MVGRLRLLLVAPFVLASLALEGAEPVERLPFTWTPGQIEVSGRIEDVQATFLLDTGSEYSVVSTRVASLLGLTIDRSRGRDFADDVTLRLGGLSLQHQRVMVMPFDTYSARGRRIDGLLGYDLFSRFVTGIDFGARMITLWAPGKYKPPKAAVAVPIEFAGRLPLVSCTLTVENGRVLPARLVIDTGASQSVILRYPFANDRGLLDTGSVATATTAPSLASGELHLIDIPMEQISLSRWTFDRPHVQAHREPSGSGASTASDGLIGNGLLSRFTLIVDYAHRRLFLQPLRRTH